MIYAKELEVNYGEKRIVKRISMEIKPGEIVSIIGPNGSGKSTILKVLSRLLKPSGGVAYLDGYDIQHLPTKEVARKLSILSQHNNAPYDFTVKEIVSFGRAPYKKWYEITSSKDEEIIEWALEVTKLTHLANRFVNTLSGGEKQRAWIAMTLAQKTKVLLLDEPTTYLDIAHQLEIMELLYEINRKHGVTVIMVLHDLNQAARFSDRMFAIKDGKLVASGTPNEILTKEMMKKIFNIEAQILIDKSTLRPVFLPLCSINKNKYKLLKIGV
ncbi:ABC transporter ATP-binding protein [Thermosipho ferrireducens]|uniref:ABC transporter ATP-binding protein n=1 Tax=Thermosipho ferrireducens TaxID=2571116 RepID=A0ABX7S8D0_9BACT|nr:ABC transporter ATP-binding protein [Thermosipho ferrireducens]QTA37531.1 ABC transporter ATP-binding protein [Thermosipho ferrireducens]